MSVYQFPSVQLEAEPVITLGGLYPDPKRLPKWKRGLYLPQVYFFHYRDVQLSPHFNLKEFSAKDHEKWVFVHPLLVTKLEFLRSRLERPIWITPRGGYRGPGPGGVNDRAGGAPFSMHQYGKAADIVVTGMTPKEVARAAEGLFDGIGRYKTFTHVDVRGYKARWIK